MKKLHLLLLFLFLAVAAQAQTNAPARWDTNKATAWYKKQPWLFGSNYNPANAINQLEMFQADSFDPATIDKELAWAESLGVNTARVYLHDLLWQDPAGFTKRLDQFLSICAKHKIRPMLVLFDSCWDPHPALGKQRDPQPGIHNSGWVQSPGADALTDVSQYPRLEAYVKGVVGAFKNDPRILMWDVWNEPDNTNGNSYGKNHLNREPANKVAIVTRLLPEVFKWARSVNPTQPLTSGVWIFSKDRDMSKPENWTPMEKVQFVNSDITTFHHYADVESFERVIKELKAQGRPLICTEFMARGADSKFQTHLPVAKKYDVGMINWGFVAGKTQTYIPWDSWQNPYVNGREPSVWFHEILKQDGTPVDEEEITAIKAATGKLKKAAAAY
ncbi:cellulase family glycosylhydrolase [Telluribacter sp. SYSU D00476]|uniref:cellulase family glycosylhydrolase n=1 Tax=Telluribacter sp. SYSU D00476 TaxID=2811430 RepID=UPI001FF2BA41|nr:cellulase family glycosylhydrolase [Telluribacter sp. SYSU D00476]